jgi:hypothetical protein
MKTFKFSKLKADLVAGQLMSRKSISAERLEKNATIEVESHCNALLCKGGNIKDVLNPGTYNVFDKKQGTLDGVDVVFLAKTTTRPVPWAVSPMIDMLDPITNIAIKLGGEGGFEVRIADIKKFYTEVISTESSYMVVDLQERLQRLLMSKFRPALARIMEDNRYTYFSITAHQDKIEKEVHKVLKDTFAEYGIEMTTFFIEEIRVPQSDKQKIQKALDDMDFDHKEEGRKQKAKEELKEHLDYIERLADKEWEKEKYILALKQRDYEAYLNVVKVIGWQHKDISGSIGVAPSTPNCVDKPKIDSFKQINCFKCNRTLAVDSTFCNGCGSQVSGKRKCCCGKENALDSAFCGSCGKKL